MDDTTRFYSRIFYDHGFDYGDLNWREVKQRLASLREFTP
jgi:hypothetical protein